MTLRIDSISGNLCIDPISGNLCVCPPNDCDVCDLGTTPQSYTFTVSGIKTLAPWINVDVENVVNSTHTILQGIPPETGIADDNCNFYRELYNTKTYVFGGPTLERYEGEIVWIALFLKRDALGNPGVSVTIKRQIWTTIQAVFPTAEQNLFWDRDSESTDCSTLGTFLGTNPPEIPFIFGDSLSFVNSQQTPITYDDDDNMAFADGGDMNFADGEPMEF